MKKTLLIGLLFLVLLATGVQGALTDGLLSYYTFDRANITGTTLIDTIGTKNGTLQNGVLTNQTGLINDSIYFDMVNDQVLIANAHQPTAFTYMVWVDSGAMGEAAYKYFIGHNADVSMGYWTNTDQFYGRSNAVGVQVNLNQATFEAGGWFLYVFQNNGARSWLRIYNTTGLVGNATTAYPDTISYDTANMYLGANNGANLWKGYMDSLGVWNRTLSVSEIFEYWNSSINGIDPIFGGGGAYLNITDYNPPNNTVIYTNDAEFNVTVNSSANFNCSLWINGTLNQTKNGLAGSNTTLDFNATLDYGTWIWYFNCTNGAVTDITPERTLFIEPWWNDSYTHRMEINCTNLTDGKPFVVNGSTGFIIDGDKQVVWTACQGTGTAVYYNDSTDYVIANDTTKLPFEVEYGNGTSYDILTLWGNNNEVLVLNYGMGSNSIFTPDSLGLHNGTVVNSAYGTGTGIIDGAYTTNSTDRIVVGDFTYCTTACTILSWVKKSSMVDNDVMFWQWTYGVLFRFENGDLAVSINEGANVLRGSTLGNNQWYQVAMTFDASAANDTKLWVNGSLDAQTDLGVASIGASGESIYITQREITYVQPLDGIMSHIHVYDTALNSTEINRDWNNIIGTSGFGDLLPVENNLPPAPPVPGGNANITIHDIYITPQWPNYDDQLNCNFNVTSNLTMNISVTWWNSTDNITWNNVGAYDHTFNNAANGTIITTGAGTGSMTGTPDNYTYWMCGITVYSGTSNKSDNSTGEGIFPLENLTLHNPPNNTLTNQRLEANYSIINWDGGIVCNLTVAGVIVNGTATTNGTQTIIGYTPPGSGSYDWNISCTANGHPTRLYSETRTFIYDITPPAYNNYGDNSTAVYPEIGDVINLYADVSDANNVSFCYLQINNTFAGTWYNASNITINAPSYNASFNFTIPGWATAHHQNISWRLWCNDSIGNADYSLTQNFTVVDVTNPVITINNKNFNDNNLSIISGALYNLTYNITYEDLNLFQMEINITCDLNGTIFLWQELNFTGNNYTYANTTSLEYPLQHCTFFTAASDDHTIEAIPEYEVEEKYDGLAFKTEHELNVQVVTKDNDLDDVKATKEKDRYTFDFTYEEKQLERTFKVSSDHKIYYRPNSQYPAHFVIWDEEQHKGNWVDFAEYGTERSIQVVRNNDYDYDVIINAKTPTPITPENEEELKEDYGINEFKFSSIGGTNIVNKSYQFYIGGYINLTSFNIYDNGTFTNFTADVATINSYPGLNTTINSGVNDWMLLENISNGTYWINFTHPWFFPVDHNVTVANLTQNLTYESFQAQLNVMVRQSFGGMFLKDLNITLNNTGSGQINFQYNNVTNTTTFYLNATLYDLLMQKFGYADHTQQVNLTYQENRTIIILLSQLMNFMFVDENTLDPFNVTSADNINLLIFCPGSTLSYTINDSNQSIPITCNYTKFKLVLTYGTSSYYRTFLLYPDLMAVDGPFNQSIYLINLLTTNYIYNSFILDDLLDDYDNPSIYVKKGIGNETVQITANWVDIENKIGAYLIENHEYIIEVHSDNNPVRVMGDYSADIGGEKTLRLYDINLGSGANTFVNTVSHATGIYNESGDQMVVAVYNDTANQTLSVTWNVYSGAYNGTLEFTSTVLNTPNIEFTYNATALYNTTPLYSELIIVHETGTHTSWKMVSDVLAIALEIFDYVGKDFFNWFFTILLSVIAIMATVETANYVSMIMLGAAALFVAFGWFGLSWAAISVSILVALITLLWKGDKNIL